MAKQSQVNARTGKVETRSVASSMRHVSAEYSEGTVRIGPFKRIMDRIV